MSAISDGHLSMMVLPRPTLNGAKNVRNQTLLSGDVATLGVLLAISNRVGHCDRNRPMLAPKWNTLCNATGNTVQCAAQQ